MENIRFLLSSLKPSVEVDVEHWRGQGGGVKSLNPIAVATIECSKDYSQTSSNRSSNTLNLSHRAKFHTRKIFEAKPFEFPFKKLLHKFLINNPSDNET